MLCRLMWAQFTRLLWYHPLGPHNAVPSALLTFCQGSVKAGHIGGSKVGPSLQFGGRRLQATTAFDGMLDITG